MADPAASPDRQDAELLIRMLVDPVWYRARHADVAASGMDPLRHFIDVGLAERRDPNRWFDGAWYARQYADVGATGAHALLHYLSTGAGLGRDPHPRFDAGWYTRQHPEATGNALLFHLRIGAAQGWLTEKPVAVEDYLPSTRPPFAAPDGITVDVIVPVYRDLALTRRCLRSVLADTDRPDGAIVVIDDCSPEPLLSAWLDRLARDGAITLLRNKKNLGFVRSVNNGMRHAGTRDVVLLNSDTEVTSGWLRRLQAQAYAGETIASVSPLSNNATICGWLSYEGTALPDGVTPEAVDAACRAANAGRFAEAPTTVGFCMYIRRAALDDIGLFDAETFGKGYGEENDFCLRASAKGWRHQIACDTFVWHAGGASFGAAANAGVTRAFRVLTERYPDYPRLIAEFVDRGETEPFRFVGAMAMLRASGLPMVLSIAHEFSGGVGRHVLDLVSRDAGRANHILLRPAARGVALSVPALPRLPELVLAAERWRDLAKILRCAGVTRAHIHHLMGLDVDVRTLLHDLGVKFDVTVHDYFAICPQVTLLPRPNGPYCGEPGPAGCDACIAARPSHGATDILSWRWRWAWQFQEAERVIAPSVDAVRRLGRHGVTRAEFVAHETITPGPWRLLPARPGKRLRVALLGVLADHKGAQLVASAVLAAPADQFEFVLIGETETGFPAAARRRMKVHGAYREGELPALLAKYRPHVAWFPAAWPETHSFTLSAAIDAGLPIVAGEIGAFPERLHGRPLSWLLPPDQDAARWLALLSVAAREIRFWRPARATPQRRPPKAPHHPDAPAPKRTSTGLLDMRREDAISVVVVPETFDDGSPTPCAHIRLLRPLDHPASGQGVAVTLADSQMAMRYRADVIVTQRHAVPTVAAAKALAAHAEQTGAVLIYDLDDDLTRVPAGHPEAAALRGKAAIVEQMIRSAAITRTSTAALAARVSRLARQVQILPNALDERIWTPAGPRRDEYGPVRLLCMGTATHDADFAMILPALTALRERFGDQFQLDMIGFVAATPVPAWIRRVPVPLHATRSYPGFVNWIACTGAWDIGLAPLAGTPFNDCKSAIKALDYAALGLATLASNVPAYRGSLADGPGGMLAGNTAAAWHEALSWLIRDKAARRRLIEGATEALAAGGTLAATAEAWRKSWLLPVRRKRMGQSGF